MVLESRSTDRTDSSDVAGTGGSDTGTGTDSNRTGVRLPPPPVTGSHTLREDRGSSPAGTVTGAGGSSTTGRACRWDR